LSWGRTRIADLRTANQRRLGSLRAGSTLGRAFGQFWSLTFVGRRGLSGLSLTWLLAGWLLGLTCLSAWRLRRWLDWRTWLFGRCALLVGALASWLLWSSGRFRRSISSETIGGTVGLVAIAVTVVVTRFVIIVVIIDAAALRSGGL
jgi:hypothetical protein